jgi:hypothetical protein
MSVIQNILTSAILSSAYPYYPYYPYYGPYSEMDWEEVEQTGPERKT